MMKNPLTHAQRVFYGAILPAFAATAWVHDEIVLNLI
ncbi:hypothetical protein SAMN05216563_104272 [Phytobacter palmae]|nr:hypothetical protein SAMN05216563_104272 [Phytobacter palmae]